ncbi:hypothetical protein QN412_09900 [Pseudomonas sp. RTB3]|uniref:hypothetical protein n=1 Tax=unclassified Pseudomonas TaxID=196821 RepID=UPI002B231605|nr:MULTISPECIES: hypothetical protein [unclassified Pseudomonas]MEB0006636.1 hypothetical protein [Pseudomonas sp. RTB2]MEB0017268.1 hypothetical protein [Pseudomonas sp. RTB3]MEB0270645.1 hypothetical protein [Pseudomonas sp. 5B4]
MQPSSLESDINPEEVFQLVFREIKSHEETGRKNFVVRVPVDLVEYLFCGILQKSGMSKVALERLLTELGIYGFKDADGRILRRYLSGQTRMAWDTYQRLLFWALSKAWVSDWVFRDLLLRTYLREAAQLSARNILNTLKRRVSISDLTREQVIECFNGVYLLKQREREETALNRARTDSELRELACSLGLEIID